MEREYEFKFNVGDVVIHRGCAKAHAWLNNGLETNHPMPLIYVVVAQKLAITPTGFDPGYYVREVFFSQGGVVPKGIIELWESELVPIESFKPEVVEPTKTRLEEIFSMLEKVLAAVR